ncbi:MAG: uroporphyrinogen decarboxylase [Xanthomonadales bacterium]|nr:uroporphyrinogen decarboxylase [Xanthomonadales bacterium]MCE7930568.1 uroporphyrinogen decarboxylase [Xanthomonadales bacterium PRO6]
MTIDDDCGRHNRFLRALRRQRVDTTPVWVMRQAGRYLPEYRATRQRAGSFMNLCRSPELACEVTLQPVERFELDAAILFSDILTIPDAMGLGLGFVEGEGPRFARPLRTLDAITRLAVPDPEMELRYVPDAVRLIRRELRGRVPLIGFAGSPWTLACYMVEGGPSEGFARIKKLMWDHPEALHHLLGVLTQAVRAYLEAQVRAGAQAIMLFDSWGGVLAPGDYREFSLANLCRLAQGIDRGPEQVPLIVFSRGANGHLEALSQSGADALGIDWTQDLGEARARTDGRVALQGNLDPAAMYASPASLRQQVDLVLRSYGDGPGHVFNLGHGITPDVDPEQMRVLVDAVHQLGRPRDTLA